MVFHYKESGSNVIPNKSLWIQFPLLVKVGLAEINLIEWRLKPMYLCHRMDFCSHLDPVSPLSMGK